MSRFQPPVVPFVEARYQGRKQRPKAIFISSSHTTSEEGAALGLSNAWHRKISSLPAPHYVVDEKAIYRCIPDHKEAERKPGRGAIHVHLCSEPFDNVSFWDDAEHVRVLDLAEDLVAQLALAYRIPIRLLAQEDEDRWLNGSWLRRSGVANQVVGEFPTDRFLQNVREQMVFFKTTL